MVVTSKAVDWSNLPRHPLAALFRAEVPPRHSANVIDYKITEAVGRDPAAAIPGCLRIGGGNGAVAARDSSAAVLAVVRRQVYTLSRLAFLSLLPLPR